MSYEKQIEENNRDIILKKLSSEIIRGKTTESTAMEPDAEGGASFEQLQDLIKNECEKRDKNYCLLEQKYNKLHESLVQSPQKTRKRGAKEAPQTKRQAATTVWNKITQLFGFVADPTKTLLHNASSTLAHTPTWYYFSRPSHLAFHDFIQSKQPANNLRSLLGLGLKFIPTPRCTNTWKN